MPKINGVDVDQLMATVEAVKETPGLANFEFRIENKWVKGGHNRSTVSDFHGAGEDHAHENPFVLDNGEHPVLLSEDEGANPVEFALHALAGCLTTSLVYHAAARGIDITSVESRLEGDLNLQGFLGLDENVRSGYENIRVKFKVDADASAEELDELVEWAQKRSPVFDIVSNAVPVDVELETT